MRVERGCNGNCMRAAECGLARTCVLQRTVRVAAGRGKARQSGRRTAPSCSVRHAHTAPHHLAGAAEEG
jgi:hypothetical protein